MPKITDFPFFTPRTPDGERLKFATEDITVISGELLSRGDDGAVIEVGGVQYLIGSASCGLGCHCDAIATVVVTS